MCCLFGIIDYKSKLTYIERKRLLKNLSVCCEERGTDATGIAFNEDNQIRIIKCGIPAHKFHCRLPRDIRVIMGHTRLTTQGSEKMNFNNHPFRGNTDNHSFALAHNGIIYNDDILKDKLNLPETKIETDSYVAVQLIEKEKTFDMDAIKKMAENVKGSFCFTLLDDENSIYIVKGDNPMAVFNFKKEGFIIYASTKEILKNALIISGYGRNKYDEIRLSIGDILKINDNGEMEKYTFDFDDWYGYRYGGYYGYYGYYYDDWYENTYYKGIGRDQNTNNSSDNIYNNLIEYAAIAGVSEEEIMYLLENEYSLWEIGEMLDEPDGVERCINKLIEKECVIV